MSTGELRAVGRVAHQGGRMLVAESQLFDAEERLLGQGSGIFTRSAIQLNAAIGYR